MSDKNNNKNDKFLMIAKPVFFVAFIVFAVVWLLLTVFAFVANWINGLVTLITGALGLALYAFIVPLVLSYLVDVKIMRNKMLGRQQPELENYWEGWTGIFPFASDGGTVEQRPATDDRRDGGEDEDAE